MMKKTKKEFIDFVDNSESYVSKHGTIKQTLLYVDKCENHMIYTVYGIIKCVAYPLLFCLAFLFFLYLMGGVSVPEDTFGIVTYTVIVTVFLICVLCVLSLRVWRRIWTNREVYIPLVVDIYRHARNQMPLEITSFGNTYSTFSLRPTLPDQAIGELRTFLSQEQPEAGGRTRNLGDIG